MTSSSRASGLQCALARRSTCAAVAAAESAVPNLDLAATEPKRRIALAFSRAAERYEDQAPIQREVALRLAERIAALPLPREPRVLEIGAGTGLLSRLLLDRIPGGTWLLTDVSEPMLRQCQAATRDPRARFAVADGESPPGGPYDLVVSSLAIQWFSDLESGLHRLGGCLAPGGTLAVATLAEETFREWRTAHADLGLRCGARVFPSGAQVDAMWPRNGSSALEEERLVARYADGYAFLRSLKAIGASTPRDGHRPLPPRALKRVIDAIGIDCRVTYHVLFGRFTAEKRPS